jgi:hypothetical protein
VTATLDFPSVDSTLWDSGDGVLAPLGKGGTSGGVYVWDKGDYVEETFVDTKVPVVASVDFSLEMDDYTNSTACPHVTDLHFGIYVNDTDIGEYSFPYGLKAGTVKISDHLDLKTPVSGAGKDGDEYTIRYEALETVCGGGGSYNWFAGGSFVLNP